MHIAFNAWFWGQIGVGTGQYFHQVLAALLAAGPDLRVTLISPSPIEHNYNPDRVAVRVAAPTGSGHWAKLRFEQQIVPREAAASGADLLHVPYWASPMQSPIPSVVTIHDMIPMVLPEYRGGLLSRFYTGLVAASARGASAVITVSHASKADIVQRLNIPAERVHVTYEAAAPIYTPEDGGLFDTAVKRKYDLPKYEFVLYLGGFDIRKNVHNLLKAYTYVRDGADDMFPLVIAGKLPQKTNRRFMDYNALIDEMDLGNVVKLIGWVDEEDKPALYRLARVFVYPSHYEGFGLPILEAMASGTPVVTSDVTSPPELLGDAGFAVNPYDARRMAGSMLAICNQDNLYNDLRTKAIQQAAKFSWERTAQETLAVYRQVLGI